MLLPSAEVLSGMLARDHWYIACPSLKLAERKPLAAQFGDLQVVVFRGQKGEPHALLDRCCHRGVKLSRGRVRENGCIACGYHGWEYDAQGNVQHIPSLGDGNMRSKFQIPSFHVREVDHYIWVWIPGESEAPTYEPGLRGFVPGTWIQYSGIWKCNVSAAVENQLDTAHPVFSHPTTYPTFETDRELNPELFLSTWRGHVENGNRVEIYFLPSDGSPVQRPTIENPGSNITAFEMPYRNYVFLTSANVRAIYNWIPISEDAVRLEYMSLSWPPKEPGDFKVRIWDEELEILAQDRVLLESAQGTYNPSRDKHVPADRPPLAARQIIHFAHQLAAAPPKNQEFDFEVYA